MKPMNQYAILRRHGWSSPDDLQKASERSHRVMEEEMADEARWIRSYILQEDDGGFGTICIYEAVDDDAVRRHASRAGLPVDEVLTVGDTVVMRPDPTRPEAEV